MDNLLPNMPKYRTFDDLPSQVKAGLNRHPIADMEAFLNSDGNYFRKSILELMNENDDEETGLPKAFDIIYRCCVDGMGQ